MNEALLKDAFRAFDAYKPKEVKRFRKNSKSAKIQKVPRKSAENRDVFFGSKFDPATGVRCV